MSNAVLPFIVAIPARYGSTQAVGNQVLFQHDGFSICVYFDGAHSGMEVFLRDGSKPGKTDFTEQDVEQILAAEGDKPEDKYLTIMLNAK